MELWALLILIGVVLYIIVGIAAMIKKDLWWVDDVLIFICCFLVLAGGTLLFDKHYPFIDAALVNLGWK